MPRFLVKTMTSFFAIGVLSVGLCAGTARAEMVGTDAVLNQAPTDNIRDQVRDGLHRDDVRKKLVEFGIEPTEADARVASLTDEEVKVLAQNIDSLPAGAGTDTVTLLLIIIILILLL